MPKEDTKSYTTRIQRIIYYMTQKREYPALPKRKAPFIEMKKFESTFEGRNK